MRRKAGSLIRCERMNPKKEEDMASKRDGVSHQRRAKRESKSWSSEGRMIEIRTVARVFEIK